ncbi:hypothetical protein [Corallococcus terminator]|uniref:Uncharacterized protein n=1 Tax=Corallococcus terminator TaxID=2316733 RepID=A0A3A8HTG4_9BACT|nr:hypothetical protein [Corallococcus terminator]RKG74135.1 hypothetical protein D7V88_35310 [Corallococcus terminator]
MPGKIGGGSFKPKLSPAPSLSPKPQNTVASSAPSTSTATTSKKRPLDAVDGSASASGSNKKTKTDAEPKDNTTEARLKRAEVRAKRRQESSSAVDASGGRSGVIGTAQGFQKMDPKKDGKQRVETPFGPVNASKFPTTDPAFKITSKKKDYGKQTVGGRYSHLVPALKSSGASDKDIATDLLDALDGGNPSVLTDDKSKNAAAKLTAIMNVSEPMRVGGSDKAGRAALRMVQDGKISLEEAFTGTNPSFPMAVKPDYMRRAVNYEDKNYRKAIETPTQFDKIGGYMSDSSDDDS